MSWKSVLGIAVLGALAAIQLVPVDRDNPPHRSATGAPPEVERLLRAACYDCHSNEVTWPWYSRVAPVSWIISGHVKEAREHLNFSELDQTPSRKLGKRMEEAAEEVGEGKMPLWSYRIAHPEARLDAAERQLLIKWFEEQANVRGEAAQRDESRRERD
jgi:hypothetical protein